MIGYLLLCTMDCLLGVSVVCIFRIRSVCPRHNCFVCSDQIQLCDEISFFFFFIFVKLHVTKPPWAHVTIGILCHDSFHGYNRDDGKVITVTTEMAMRHT